MKNELTLQLIDTHAGGDVSRIVTGGVDPLPGATVRQQMEYLRDDADGLRKLLLEEPYGAPEMSVDLIVPPSDSRAETGYIIMEVMGYPIYSGSNTICTATAVLESGLVPKREGHQHFLLESPAGLVQIDARVENGVVEAITCGGLPSYIDTYRAAIHVPGLGDITYSVAYSGGFYALVDARDLGFHLTLDEERDLARCAGAIVEAIQAERGFSHYTLGDVGPLPFLHFMGPVDQVADDFYRSRSATYVHPGVICRSTTGTGTSARLALMHHEGGIRPGDKLETVSLRESGFIGEFLGVEQAGADGHDVVRNTITGKGHVLARSEIVVNCDDPMVECAGLHHILTSRHG
ncbi:proline racemase family protein [Alloalcanivorax profundimaris]|uniref:Proline racemase n=1 Tax=Alloalcanivorax profundimaris TaxID=2735259 RepID=A0ABS0ATK9_9GAMM|nr:proline racemase family protein [Alloalcanivorax profundimaris]MAO59650.1 proline racemase [Alcanivorax sp.]MBM1144689.1 proline racemase family protein [Alcanivorax sp. ZXX171]MCQ6261338.1 proline racemase family protein [Alcanivorax sp. MM125-6]UWN51344.1 Trans-3-hydroxy-L-proline dehydratase [Alcanivorax sp. ALC70]MAY09088.1 proline racemase [Alcanivorax sp.]|tara:strand:+ start:49384 stop:50430 length:1047 start_codon:yes stop_codon:yes gene_type:complete